MLSAIRLVCCVVLCCALCFLCLLCKNAKSKKHVKLGPHKVAKLYGVGSNSLFSIHSNKRVHYQ